MELLDTNHPDLVLLAALAVIAAIATLAQRSHLPYPVYLVLAGIGVGFAPGTPRVVIEPEVVFLVFLPPLVYAAAYFTSLRELRRNIRAVSLLAVGLVLATMLVVAGVAHALVPSLTWPVAFVLGAIVSPTDTVAASAVIERLHVPRRVVHITEGESLLNDGTGLVLFAVAVAAVVDGSFDPAHAVLRFFASIIGGIAIGIGVGTVLTWVRRSNSHGPTDVLLSLLSGYLAYLPAEAVHVSGVLATAAAALWLGWRTPTIVRDAGTRLQIEAVWVNVAYVINTLLFLLVGLQLPGILDRLDGATDLGLWRDALLVGVAVIVTRIAWVFPLTYLPRWVSRGIRERETSPSPRAVALVAWIGIRGAVTLAAALAVPATIDGGAPFPSRDLVVFLAFGTILVTLVVQGLTMPMAVRVLDPPHDDSYEEHEVWARLMSTEAALAAVDRLRDEDWVRQDSLERLRAIYDYRLRRMSSRIEHGRGSPYEERARHWLRMLDVVHDAERAELLRLRNDGELSDEAMQAVLRDLDLEDARNRA